MLDTGSLMLVNLQHQESRIIYSYLSESEGLDLAALGIGVFLIGGIIAASIAWLTVSFHFIKAARQLLFLLSKRLQFLIQSCKQMCLASCSWHTMLTQQLPQKKFQLIS